MQFSHCRFHSIHRVVDLLVIDNGAFQFIPYLIAVVQCFSSCNRSLDHLYADSVLFVDFSRRTVEPNSMIPRSVLVCCNSTLCTSVDGCTVRCNSTLYCCVICVFPVSQNGPIPDLLLFAVFCSFL